MVAIEVARTIRHEAEHGVSWATQYYTHKKNLSEMNIGEEEQRAEKAESSISQPTESISDESAGTDTLSNADILKRAINVVNKNMPFHIPPERVQDTHLSPDRWGEFEMSQGPQEASLQYSTNQAPIAWDKENKVLKVDVDAIVEKYNEAIMQFSENRQMEGGSVAGPSITPSSGGTGTQSVPSVPAASSVPSIGAR
jgi:hypothetical protein